MKVLIYTHEYPPFKGGIATSSKKIADILKTRFNVVVCCPKYSNTRSIEMENLKIIRMSFIGGNKFKKIPILQYVQGLMNLKKILINEKPNFLLYLGEEAEIVGGLLNNRSITQIVRIAGSGIKSILENNSFTKILKKKLMKRLYKNSRDIIAVSENTKNLLITSKEFDENNKIKLIYNGLEDEFIEKSKNHQLKNKLGFNDDDFILLTVSRVLPRKGQDNVIRALSKIKNNKIKYLCVGDGSHLNNFKELVKKLNLNERVIFIGEVDREETSSYYDIADAFILCNRTWNNKIEGLPNVVLEAMGRGKAIIGSKNTGTEELIINNKNGFHVNPENITEIKNTIIHTYENKNRLVDMGAYSLELIKRNFSNKIMSEKYIGLFNED